MPRRLAAAGLLALAVSACGGGQEGFHFEVHPADGTVVRKGKPVPGAFVRFHPTDPATVQIPEGRQGPPVMLTTETDPDGRFAMSTYTADDGVPAGEYAVTVAIGLAEEGDVENSDGPRTAKPRKPRLDAIYRDPAQTPLKASVKPGENRFSFEQD